MSTTIFNGKKGRYNTLILKALFENKKLSAWHIAKYIVENDILKRKPKTNWYHQTQKVNSVLLRKNGRLQELTEKIYIAKKNGEYTLTYKGLGLALTLYSEKWVEQSFSDENIWLEALEDLKAKAAKFTDEEIDDLTTYARYNFLPLKLSNSELNKIMRQCVVMMVDLFSPHDLVKIMKLTMEEWIKKKIYNLDGLTNNDFALLISASSQEFFAELIKNKFEKSGFNGFKSKAASASELIERFSLMEKMAQKIKQEKKS